MCKYPMIDIYCNFIKRGRQEKTVELVENRLTCTFRSLEEDFGVKFEPYHIEGLDATVLVQWYSALEEDRKTTTLNNYVCILNPFLRWAAQMDRMGVPYIYKDLSHVLTTRKIEIEDRSEKYITGEDVKTLLSCPTGRNKVRDRAIIALFLGSGLRVSELCSLTIADVMDGERGMLFHVLRKGGKYQDLEIADYVYSYIEKYLETRPNADHSEPLFMTTHGKPCSPHQIYQALSFKQKELGLATGPHALRHTFISETEKHGGGAVTRDLAGHKSLIITNRYDHSTHDQRKQAVNSLSWAN